MRSDLHEQNLVCSLRCRCETDRRVLHDREKHLRDRVVTATVGASLRCRTADSLFDMLALRSIYRPAPLRVDDRTDAVPDPSPTSAIRTTPGHEALQRPGPTGGMSTIGPAADRSGAAPASLAAGPHARGFSATRLPFGTLRDRSEQCPAGYW